MERKSRLHKYVKATLVRLRIEKIIYTMQTGLFLAAFCAILLLLVSRLFVLPSYGRFTVLAAGIVLIGTAFYTFYHRVKREEAVRRLDSYVPNNLLLTALSIEKSDSSLAPVIIQEGEKIVEKAFLRFKKRKKAYINPKVVSAFIVCCACIVVLVTFPSEAQLEADTIEKEQQIVTEMTKEIQRLIRKEELPEVKKELVNLLEELEIAETSEQALGELVKKQKELRLKEQRLAEKKEVANESGSPSDPLTEAEELELDELGEVTAKLAGNVGEMNTALNKIGKTSTFPALADGTSNLSNEDGEENPASGESSGKGKSDGEKSDENGGGKEEGEGKKGEGEGEGEGQGQGQGQGKGEGQGGGTGTGVTGTGKDAGQGKGIGSGSGGRDLLTIPNNRIGTQGESSLDGGKVNKGDHIEEKEVDGLAEKGTVRPYSEVIGTYNNSYLESAGKMNLSQELQQVLSNYFTSIE